MAVPGKLKFKTLTGITAGVPAFLVLRDSGSLSVLQRLMSENKNSSKGKNLFVMVNTQA